MDLIQLTNILSTYICWRDVFVTLFVETFISGLPLLLKHLYNHNPLGKVTKIFTLQCLVFYVYLWIKKCISRVATYDTVQNPEKNWAQSFPERHGDPSFPTRITGLDVFPSALQKRLSHAACITRLHCWYIVKNYLFRLKFSLTQLSNV